MRTACGRSGWLWIAAPGPLPGRKSASFSIRVAGTNTSLVTIVLLPVPFMPAVNQVSRIVHSRAGIMKKAQSGFSPSCTRAPIMSQVLLSTPLANGEFSPVTR